MNKKRGKNLLRCLKTFRKKEEGKERINNLVFAVFNRTHSLIGNQNSSKHTRERREGEGKKERENNKKVRERERPKKRG